MIVRSFAVVIGHGREFSILDLQSVAMLYFRLQICNQLQGHADMVVKVRLE